MKKKRLFKLILTALMASLVAVCSQIAIPFAGVPMTLQTFAVALCAYLLGISGGVLAVLIYLVLGAVGLPVFAGVGGSLAFLFGPTGGFLFGFLALAFFCALGEYLGRGWRFLFGSLGLFLCHASGVLWFMYVAKISFGEAFLLGSAPYLIKDIISLVFAWILIHKIRQRWHGMLLFSKAS